MKIFVPMPDEILIDRGDLSGRLVPFSPDFLVPNECANEGKKPRNWISDNDYSTAVERLRLNGLSAGYATA